jgi:hypothetical protein
MSEFNNLGIIANNTIVSIIIIALILCFLPACSYIWSFFYSIEEEKLLNKFMKSEIKTDMEYNTRANLYLLCNYIPYKQNKRCEKFEPNDPEIKDYNTFLTHAYNIKEKFDKIKRECDGQFYNNIKKESDKQIQLIKTARVEHEEKMHELEFERLSKDDDRRFKWITSIFSGLKNGGDLGIKIGNMFILILKFFVPITAAGIGNHVLMGFVILVFIIFMILYFVKIRNTNSTNPVYSMPKSETNLGINSWFSWFNGNSIWSEMKETYNYYDTMMNTFSNSMSDYTGGIFFSTEDNTEDGTNNGAAKSNIVLNRNSQEGKRYDNLSYIMLSELNLTEIEKTKLREYLPIGIENLKYYNIYLPEEKFKYNDKQSIVKWKIENSKNNPNEKIWKINCREIDNIKNNGVITGTSAFIEDDNDKNKCIININELNAANAAVVQDIDEFMYTPEQIL